jgi:hydrogenase nickel incorporation protein HypB
MVNLMASPGSGKITVLAETFRALLPEMRIGVVEADIDSKVDAEAVAERNVPVVQMHTGGFCLVDAFMMEKCLDAVDRSSIDLLFLENVGNLICPAQSDTGAHFNVVLLSVPEGDDKPLKYPIIFRKSDVLVITKTDYLPVARFDSGAVRKRVSVLNPSIELFYVHGHGGNRRILLFTSWF